MSIMNDSHVGYDVLIEGCWHVPDLFHYLTSL